MDPVISRQRKRPHFENMTVFSTHQHLCARHCAEGIQSLFNAPSNSAVKMIVLVSQREESEGKLGKASRSHQLINGRAGN